MRLCTMNARGTTMLRDPMRVDGHTKLSPSTLVGTPRTPRSAGFQVDVRRVARDGVERAQLLLPMRQRGRDPRAGRELGPVSERERLRTSRREAEARIGDEDTHTARRALNARLLTIRPHLAPDPHARPRPCPRCARRQFKVYDAHPQDLRGAPTKKLTPDYFL